MWRHRIWRLLLTAVALSGLGGRSSASASDQPQHWAQIPAIPGAIQFKSVAMVNETSAWAVGADGAGGVVYRLQLANARWTATLDQRFASPATALAAIAPDSIWVVGEDGLLAQKTASGWTVLPAPVAGADLTAIQMLGAGEAGWIGGTSGGAAVLLRYAGGAWQRETAPIDAQTITGLHFAQEGGWVAGGDHVMARYRAGAWSQDWLRSCAGSCVQHVAGVRAIDADTAWAVGTQIGYCAICTGSSYRIYQRADGSWQERWTAVEGAPHPPPGTFTTHSSLSAVTFAGASHGLAVGTFEMSAPTTKSPLIFRYADGAWRSDLDLTTHGGLRGVSMIDQAHALAVGDDGLIMSYGYGPQGYAAPTAPAARPADPGVRYFDAVGHSLRGHFNDYWERNGGLPVFGYPLTEQLVERNADTKYIYPTQYVERQRFELHPEHKGTPYEVMLGRLGVEILELSGRNWAAFPKADPGAAHHYAATGHSIAPEFWDYWRSHGLELGAPGIAEAESLALFGYPISEAAMEANSSGDLVLTQWFERARFEYHPANPPAHRVLLGRLAAELLTARGW